MSGAGDPVAALFSGAPEVGRTDALLVQQRGQIGLEQYGDEADASTTLRSWSMAKSMLHAVVGMLVADGRLELDAPAPVAAWSDPADARHPITLRQLLEMRPGLQWNEVYSLEDESSDVVDMLFGRDLSHQPDVAAFAASKALAREPGSAFVYSSGTSNIVSGIVRDEVGAGDAYLAFLRERLFGPLGMASADPKLDDVGTWIASSYCFCTARDFASFGRLYLEGGVRDGRRLLPADWVRTAFDTISADADGDRHSMHWWQMFADRFPGSANCAGYDGQLIVVVPDLDLVAVRLGQTTAQDKGPLRTLVADVIGSFA
jgi:CubicO group peptidase (beta-lactamase class C family)